jgi:hypothetical protein
VIFFTFDDEPSTERIANAANQLTGEQQPEAISQLAELAADQARVDRATRLGELRGKRCTALGFAPTLVKETAERLAIRDSGWDDRRLCVECRNCRRSGCAKGDAWLPTIFQRCDNFAEAKLEVEHE